MKLLWMRASGLAVTAAALLMPYRLRVRFAYALNFLCNPPRQGAGLLLGPAVALYNRALLTLVYVLGLGASWLAFRLTASGEPAEGSAWRRREAPECFRDRAEDPF